MKSKIPFLSLRYAAFGLGLAAGLLALIAGFVQFESGTHYFFRGAVLPVLSAVFAILGVCAALAAGFLNPESEHPEPRRASFLPAAPGFFASALVFFFLPSYPAKVSLILAVISMILLLFSCVFCLLSFLLKDPKYRGLLSLLGFFPTLAPAVLAFLYYFDKTVEMNSPLKVALQTGLLFGMALFLCEIRRLLGRPLPRLLFGLRLALFPAASIGVGMILSTYFAGVFTRTDYLLGAILLLTLQISLLFDLFPAKKQDNI
ncbi:MAG: hypothetical protein IJR89_02200 [Clostridia bacterium]|nr:hypothetical protein [Clostridia bacterium]